MIAPSEFQRYLQSVLDTSREDTKREVSDRYIPTLAELPLRVQTAISSEPDSQEQQKERPKQFAVLEGLRKYATDHVLLVGKPGSGKSTSLRRLLWEEARDCLEAIEEGKSEIPPIPILIELRGLKGSVLAAIQEKLGWWLDLDEKTLKALLRDKRLFVFLDGLNELPNKQAWQAVDDFRQVCVNLTVSLIITTRELGSGLLQGNAKKLEMLPLTELQMQEFVYKQLPETGGELWRQIQGKLRELAETPLLLKMLCDVFKQNKEIPQSRGDLFREEFARRYKEFKPERLRNVSEDSRRFAFDLLTYLAFTMVQGEPHIDSSKPSASWIAIPETDAEKILATFLASDRTPTLEDTTKAKEWLEDLVEWHLLQIASDPTQIEFHHQLFQEYYAAEWLAPQLEKLSDEELQYYYLNYLKWTEPLTMAMSFVKRDALAVRMVKLALEVDLYLGARLAGAVKLDWQQKTIDLVISECEQKKLPQLIKVICLQKSRSVATTQSLIKALNEPGADIQAKALQGLKEIANATSLPDLLQAIEKPTGKKYPLIIDIIDLLVLLDSKKNTLPKLRELLKSEYPGLRQIAVWALARFNTKECISDLINALHNDPTIRVRRAIISALGEIGYQEIIPDLIHIIECQQEEEDNQIMLTAACALAKLAPEQALSHHHGLVRRAVISLLEKQDLEVALPRLAVGLKDTDCLVRAEAMRIIGKLKIKELIPEVLQGLEDSDTGVQMQAAYAIGQLCSVEIMPELLEKLTSKNSETRKTIVDAMQNLDSEKVVPGLFQALADSDQSVGREALHALGQLCRKNTIPHFIEIFLNPISEDYKKLTNNYLHELEEKRKLDLLEKAKSPDTYLRWEAVKELARVASKTAIPNLIKDFFRESLGNRMRIIDDLRNIANENFLPTLLDALNDTEVSIRRHAAFGIRDIGRCLDLNYLWQQQFQNPLEAIDIAIEAIQSRCGFYNYEIAQSPLPVISCLQAANFNSQARVTIVTEQQPTINFIQPNSTIGNNLAAEGSNVKIQQNVQNVTEQNRTELQALLIQLAQTYPVNTEPQKQTFIQKFLERIESTPGSVKVLLAGGIEGLKILHPAVGIPIEMLRRLYQAVEERHNQP
jgi:HEAT repeat protein